MSAFSLVLLMRVMECALIVAPHVGRSEESAMLLGDVTDWLYMWSSGSRGQGVLCTYWNGLHTLRSGEAIGAWFVAD